MTTRVVTAGIFDQEEGILPKGSLTAAQYEILEAVWACGEGGATVADIWQRVSQQRPIARTTVLNQVDRLEKRDWLTRIKSKGGYRYLPRSDQDATAQELAEGFVNDFFGGSASNLVSSLLGSNQLDRDELRKLRSLLAAKSRPKPKSE